MTDAETAQAEAARFKAVSRRHEDAAKANADAPAKLAAAEASHSARMAELTKRVEDAERQAAELEARAAAAAEVAAGPPPVTDFGVGGGDPGRPFIRDSIGDPNAGKQLTMTDIARMTPHEIVAADDEGRLDALKEHGPRYGS